VTLSVRSREIGEQVRTTVVELDDLDIVGSDASFLVGGFGGEPGHVGLYLNVRTVLGYARVSETYTSQLDGAEVVEETRRVGGHALADNLDGLVLEAVLEDERLGGDNGTRCSIRGGTAHGTSHLERDR
jgi:hypothetical protein